MLCPPDLAEIVLEIIKHGILSARAAGSAGDAKRAAQEADHIHNLPTLLANYSPALLRFYWDTERICYLAADTDHSASTFEDLWERLRPHVQPMSDAQRERVA